MASGFTAIAIADISTNTSSVTMTVPEGTSGNLMVHYKLATSAQTHIGLRFNGDTGSNYAFTTNVNWTGSGGSYYTNSATYLLIHEPENSTSYSSTGCIYIPDSQTANKCVSIVHDGGGASNRWTQGSGTWFNTASRVTSITFFGVTSARYMVDGSSLALYAMGDA